MERDAASGTQVVTTPDGVEVETHLDGTTITRRPDGSSVRTDPDSGVQVVTAADGRVTRQLPRTERRADGSTTMTLADGTTIERMADGSSRQRNPDGTIVERRADGTQVMRSAHDGVEEVRGPDVYQRRLPCCNGTGGGADTGLHWLGAPSLFPFLLRA